MAWRHPGDKPLSEPMMVSLLTHISVTRPQWVQWGMPPWCPLLGLLTWCPVLTHWGQDKIDTILQMLFSSTFSWMKMSELWLKFHWSLFLRVQITIFQHWFRKWLGAIQVTSHYLNQWWLVYQWIYTSLGLNELSQVTLTYWGWVTYIYISKLTIIGADNGLSPGQHQAIIWTNTGLLVIGPWDQT